MMYVIISTWFTMSVVMVWLHRRYYINIEKELRKDIEERRRAYLRLQSSYESMCDGYDALLEELAGSVESK